MEIVLNHAISLNPAYNEQTILKINLPTKMRCLIYSYLHNNITVGNTQIKIALQECF